MTLTKDGIQELRKPFRPDQVKWKVQTQPKDPKSGPKKLEGWGVVVSYLDARDVAERLDLVIGGDWHDSYELFGKALECSLTVGGVTRKDVGEADSAKELYSDAFKRAAVKFGVGAFLYRMPTIMAKMSRKDEYKPYQLTDAARSSLKAIAEAVSAGSAPASKYPDLMLLSEYQAPERVEDDGPPAVPAPAPAAPSKPAQGPTLNAGQAQKFHERIGAILSGTEQKGSDHLDFAAGVLGFRPGSFTELTLAEAKKVQDAAEALPKVA